jgi:phosphoserine phosphatase
MTTSSHKTEQFTGLILLTGEDKPGLAHCLFEALSPFSVAVIDVDQIIIGNRLILTIQISLNPAHQSAIEEDLNSLATTLEVDIAAVFATSPTPMAKPASLTLSLSSAKMHPKFLMRVTKALFETGANIQDLTRGASDPFKVVIKVSGVSESKLQEVISSFKTETEFTLTSGD